MGRHTHCLWVTTPSSEAQRKAALNDLSFSSQCLPLLFTLPLTVLTAAHNGVCKLGGEKGWAQLVFHTTWLCGYASRLGTH